MEIYTATVNMPYIVRQFASRTRAGLVQQVAAICRRDWENRWRSENWPHSPADLTDDQVVVRYFVPDDNVGEEGPEWHIAAVELEDGPPLSPPRTKWYVVCDPKSLYQNDPEAHIWTLSRSPREPGWETDGGYGNYGLLRADAEELARAANCLMPTTSAALP